MIPLDRDFILEVAPRYSGPVQERQHRIVDAIAEDFPGVLQAYAIHTPLRIAHFMGQVTHECAGFRTTEEFADGTAYEFRDDLGNVQEGDGPRYKGRGLLQLTGRFNYREFGARLGLPLEERPHIAADPLTSLKIACEYWQKHDINALCDRDDLRAVTRAVNGGYRGLEDRRKYYRRAKMALARIEAVIVAHDQGGTRPVLRLGSQGAEVARLQEALNAAGAMLTTDGDYGPATHAAVRRFQRDAGLLADGIVGARTWEALEPSPPAPAADPRSPATA